MVAVFFAAFPNEALKYKAELDAYYDEEEKREEEISNMLQSYIKSLSKSELQEALLQNADGLTGATREMQENWTPAK